MPSRIAVGPHPLFSTRTLELARLYEDAIQIVIEIVIVVQIGIVIEIVTATAKCAHP